LETKTPRLGEPKVERTNLASELLGLIVREDPSPFDSCTQKFWITEKQQHTLASDLEN
jgi:hypothetical protein